MKLQFYKYQGTGNDFVMIDNRQELITKNDTKKIQRICDRKFGIGADGCILLEDSDKYDFKMVYFNADGNESTMCGNGGRCIVAFANHLGIVENKTTFEAIDGLHYAVVNENEVDLQMQNVTEVQVHNDYCFLDTGSPHHVQFEDAIAEFDIKTMGAAIRYNVYGKAGSNVNFVKKLSENEFRVRTYERGVEDETLSCGTGVTAVAIAMYHTQQTPHKEINLLVEGGELQVRFDYTNGVYTNVFLKGKAEQVFKGEIEW